MCRPWFYADESFHAIHLTAQVKYLFCDVAYSLISKYFSTSVERINEACLKRHNARIKPSIP